MNNITNNLVFYQKLETESARLAGVPIDDNSNCCLLKMNLLKQGRWKVFLENVAMLNVNRTLIANKSSIFL